MSNTEQHKLPNLNALIVGINKYKFLPEANHLGGCEGDAQKIYDYLEEVSKEKFNYLPKKILNEEATRENIIQHFEEHLIANSNEGDINVFYFSGHGSTEKAAGIFKEINHDGKLQGLFCYDSGNGDGAKPLIADKELRYLIHKLSQEKGEIITIFDCCHSGDNTRLPNKDCKPKLASQTVGARKWEDFVFAKEISEPKTGEGEIINKLIPEGKHVQFAACLSTEQAYESKTKKSGFFTSALLDILKKAKGKVSYVELQRRILQELRVKRIAQKPNLYTPRGNDEELFKQFLLDIVNDQSVLGNIIYDGIKDSVTRKRFGWRLDLGNMHGVEEGQTVLVEVEEGHIEKAWVEKTYLNYSEIDFFNPDQVNFNETYTGRISSLMMHPTYVAFHPDSEQNGIDIFLNELNNREEELKNKNIYFVKGKEDVKHDQGVFYHLYAVKNSYFITNENSATPLVEKVRGFTRRSVKSVIENLIEISKWNFVRHLHNPTSEIPVDPINVTLHKDGKEYLLKPGGEEPFILGDDENWDGVKPLKFKLEFVNNSGQDLYAACLYLDSLFGVEVNFLQPTVAQLGREKGENRIWAFGGSRIEISLENHVKVWNLPHEEVRLKLLICKEPFDVNIFYKPKMRAAAGPNRDSRKGKGFNVVPESTAENLSDWCTQDFAFHIKNPD